MNSLMLDIAIILVFGIFLFLGFKNGVISAFLSFASSVFSGFLSVYFAGALSSWTYSEIIGPNIRKRAESLIIDHALTSENFFNHMPKFIVEYLKANNITSFSLDHIINNNAMSVVPDKISEFFAPIVIEILKSVFVVVLFIVFIALSKCVIKFILKLFKSSLMRKTNTLLGGFFGLLKAYVVITVALCFLRSFAYVSPQTPSWLSEESISNTVVFQKMYNNNPVYEFFKFV